MATGALAIAAALLGLALGLAGGRFLRLRRGFDLRDGNWLLLTATQGMLLLAVLSGLDQRPLARAVLFAAPMALCLGLLVAVGPGGEPTGRWWELWRWRLDASARDRR